MVSDIPAGYRKIANFFLQCMDLSLSTFATKSLYKKRSGGVRILDRGVTPLVCTKLNVTFLPLGLDENDFFDTESQTSESGTEANAAKSTETNEDEEEDEDDDEKEGDKKKVTRRPGGRDYMNQAQGSQLPQLYFNP